PEPALRTADKVIGRLVADGFDVEAAGRAFSFVCAIVRDSVHTRAGTPLAETYRLVGEDARDDHLQWIQAGMAATNPADDERQFRYNLARALDGIALTLG